MFINFFDGEDLGTQKIQSLPSTLRVWAIGLTSVFGIPKFSNGIVVVLSLGELDPHAQPKFIDGDIIVLDLNELDPLAQPNFSDRATLAILGLSKLYPPTKPKVVLVLERVCAFIATASYRSFQ
jgi:hypothetical protein